LPLFITPLLPFFRWLPFAFMLLAAAISPLHYFRCWLASRQMPFLRHTQLPLLLPVSILLRYIDAIIRMSACFHYADR
jgi:hypothetical protein